VVVCVQRPTLISESLIQQPAFALGSTLIDTAAEIWIVANRNYP
jgi:hypothetical protein